MSYEPRILIALDDLQAKQKQLLNEVSVPPKESWKDKRRNQYEACQVLYRLLDDALHQGEFISLKGMKMVNCEPELTAKNKAVRDWLTANDIEYAIMN